MYPIRVHPQLQDIPWNASLCFTGHRPEKLPRGAALEGLTKALQFYILRAIRLGFTCFYTGMADGIDYLAAHYLFRLREIRPDLFIIGIQPCEDYEDFFRYRGYSLRHLQEMRQNVNRLIILPGSAWDNGIFLRRNRVMTNHCSGIIAVCADGRSGSAYTYEYARQQGLSYCRIFPHPPSGTIPSPQNWPTEQSGFTL